MLAVALHTCIVKAWRTCSRRQHQEQYLSAVACADARLQQRTHVVCSVAAKRYKAVIVCGISANDI